MLQFYLYDPRQSSPSAELQTAKANRSLKRRYVMMLKAKEAQTVGLLAGTLGVGRCRWRCVCVFIRISLQSVCWGHSHLSMNLVRLYLHSRMINPCLKSFHVPVWKFFGEHGDGCVLAGARMKRVPHCVYPVFI